MIKLGVYLGPTGNLFELGESEELMPEHFKHNPEDVLSLVTMETPDDWWALPGETGEFKYLLEGFTYLGPL